MLTIKTNLDEIIQQQKDFEKDLENVENTEGENLMLSISDTDLKEVVLKAVIDHLEEQIDQAFFDIYELVGYN